MKATPHSRQRRRLYPIICPPVRASAGGTVDPRWLSQPIESCLRWGLECMELAERRATSSSTSIEGASEGRIIATQDLVDFQRAFIGGEHRKLEALTSLGGTRSINLAFEVRPWHAL